MSLVRIVNLMARMWAAVSGGLNGCRGNSSGAHPPTYLGGSVGSYFVVKSGRD